jgi:hypothetical protein
MPHAEANDNRPRQGPETRMFELPSEVWVVMVGCYGVFLLALLGATGDAGASFAIAISAVYIAMFFGTGRAMLRQGPAQPRSPLEQSNARLQTQFGSLSKWEVYLQVLIVPGAVAFFGVAVAVIGAAAL